MPFTDTGFPGLFIFEPKVFGDTRGYFFESYNEKTFAAQHINARFVQDNESSSVYGVIRGLHYQREPFGQIKMIRVIDGCILDVVVDLRRGSPTFGKSFSVELSVDNKKQLFIPVGFAHGFSVLSPRAAVTYKCGAFYNRESEGGIIYNDPTLNIDWRIPLDKAIVSDKDRVLPSLASCNANFVFESL